MASARKKPLFDLFNPAPKRTPWTNAYLMCLASRLAYFPNSQVSESKTRRALETWGLDRESLISVSVPAKGIDTQAFVATNRRLVYVVFRGTEPDNLKDWVSDAKFRQRRYKVYAGKVHRGFAEALQPIWSRLAKTLRARMAEVDATGIVVAGHSLGGALATLAAQRLHMAERLPVAGLYTYGCPRVGDAGFRAGYIPLRKRSYRFENNNDVVAKVPPERFLTYDYYHVCDPYYFRQDGIFVKNPGARERAIDMALGGIRAVLEPGVDGVEDHGLRHYGALIRQQVTGSALKRRLAPPWRDFW